MNGENIMGMIMPPNLECALWVIEDFKRTLIFETKSIVNQLNDLEIYDKYDRKDRWRNIYEAAMNFYEQEFNKFNLLLNHVYTNLLSNEISKSERVEVIGALNDVRNRFEVFSDSIGVIKGIGYSL